MSLPLVLPLLLVAVPFFGVGQYSNAMLRRDSARISILASTIIFLIGVSYSGWFSLSKNSLNHEKSFLVIVAVGFGALAARRCFLIMLALAAAVFAFLQYSAGTFVAVGLLGVCGYLFYHLRLGPIRTRVIAAFAGTVVVVLVLCINLILDRSEFYFRFVDKTDNASTRHEIYSQVLARTHEPLFSSWFTGPVSVPATIESKIVLLPAHSDFLSLFLGGGAVAVVIYVALYCASLVNIRTSRGFILHEWYVAAGVLSTTTWAAFVAALVNPIMFNPGSGALVVCCLATSLMITRPTDSACDQGVSSIVIESNPDRGFDFANSIQPNYIGIDRRSIK
ncbi:hypothetical protein [Gordonia sp. N1V]|uniref:hypothetical protein n=1 Tax=Gordonia sp. N1V TaxID=3034163 RepID=UPI0023E0FCD3|nr:hypothetical protein [Gordonia sp. N1V]MDF3284677.1 hypothetical protein [Gordonia sp. N1V]